MPDPRRVGVVVGLAILLAGCGDGSGAPNEAPTDPVAAAQQQVTDAEAALDEARSALTDADAQFCEDSADYVDAVDRYGSALRDEEATVGELTTAGADLEEPRETVRSSADAVVETREAVAQAEQNLADAQAALAEAQTGTSLAVPGTTTTTLPLVPPATVDRVEAAEEDLADAFEGINDETPVSEATEQVNAAAFALEVAWLRLFAGAGCLTDDQEVQAVDALASYTSALQTSLATAGYYQSAVDGVYGPQTVDAVESLQTESGLPVTGYVDRATADALDDAVAAVGGAAADEAIAHTAALQSLLSVAGYWNGPIDGQWTDALTAALQEVQTDLGVPATGVLDAQTLGAIQQAIADAQAGPPPTTTAPS
jgi:peptidoglycan hydrolase-like protein with peptidoglycan-binding domain